MCMFGIVTFVIYVSEKILFFWRAIMIRGHSEPSWFVSTRQYSPVVEQVEGGGAIRLIPCHADK
jgi:hypothetical protein